MPSLGILYTVLCFVLFLHGLNLIVQRDRLKVLQ